MAKLPISHFIWQVLRVAKRSKKPLTGRELRVKPTRHSKDGTLLNTLVEARLLEVVSVDNPDEKTKRVPAQFRTRYQLTKTGEYAAEYGEYEREVASSKAHDPADQLEPAKRPPRQAPDGEL
jgi:hypothetical protein